jgi:hypothetical protein
MVRSFLLCLAASLVVVTTMIAEETQQEKASPGSVAYLDSLAGFRGVKFGTALSEFKDLSLDREHGKLKLFTKKDENLKLGLATLGTIVYHFFDDKFYGVSLHTTDPANTQTLVAIAGTGFANSGQRVFTPPGINSAGQNDWVLVLDLATPTDPDTTAPTAPTELGATAVSARAINLAWTASTDNVAVTGYLVERCQGEGCSTFVQIATSTTTNFNNTGLLAETSYSYRVRAADAAGNFSEYSSVASAMTSRRPHRRALHGTRNRKSTN